MVVGNMHINNQLEEEVDIREGVILNTQAMIIHHRTSQNFMRVGNVQQPGIVRGLNHRSPPGAVTIGYPGFHRLGWVIPGVRLWPQYET